MPGYLLRYFGVMYGYKLGVGYLTKIQESGLMESFKTAASILGVMVIGAMTNEMVSINFAIKLGSGKNAETLQSIIDSMIPGVMSLIVLYIFYVLNKKKVNVLWQILGAAIVGITLTWFGILG